MSYRIQACLNGRRPRLEVHDASSRAVRLIGEYQHPRAHTVESHLAHEAAIDELFRRLFLLATEGYPRDVALRRQPRSRR